MSCRLSPRLYVAHLTAFLSIRRTFFVVDTRVFKGVCGSCCYDNSPEGLTDSLDM